MSYTSGITSTPLLHTLLRESDTAVQSKGTRTGATGVSAGEDRAQLSSTASVLQQAAPEDPARAEKVKSVQAAIAAGTYHVPAGAVADKLIQSLLRG